MYAIFRTCTRLAPQFIPHLQSLTPKYLNNIPKHTFCTLTTPKQPFLLLNPNITSNPKLSCEPTQCRTLTKFSWKKGKKRTVKAVLRRFYRLDWGGWIRTKCGRHKKLWKKSPPRKRRLRQHVLCNSTQSYLLDKMVCRYWRKPKYYVDDPYEPYHSREEFAFSAKKPRPYFPPEEVELK